MFVSYKVFSDGIGFWKMFTNLVAVPRKINKLFSIYRPPCLLLACETACHQYRFHDDFQSSQLGARWSLSNTCADCQSSLLFPWWLSVITTRSTLKQHICWLPVIMMTSSHHNKRNRGNPLWGANQRAVASGNDIHADWKSSGSSLVYE